MSTIKQRLYNVYEELGTLPVRHALEACTIGIFRQWLEQKREKLPHKLQLCEDCQAKMELLNELIEELKL